MLVAADPAALVRLLRLGWVGPVLYLPSHLKSHPHVLVAVSEETTLFSDEMGDLDLLPRVDAQEGMASTGGNRLPGWGGGWAGFMHT